MLRAVARDGFGATSAWTTVQALTVTGEVVVSLVTPACLAAVLNAVSPRAKRTGVLSYPHESDSIHGFELGQSRLYSDCRRGRGLALAA